jgi:hypothetical protein
MDSGDFGLPLSGDGLPLLVADIFAFVSADIGPCGLPLLAADILALDSSVCVLPLLVAVLFAMDSGDFGLPLLAADILALDSSVCVLPLLAAEDAAAASRLSHPNNLFFGRLPCKFILIIFAANTRLLLPGNIFTNNWCAK